MEQPTVATDKTSITFSDPHDKGLQCIDWFGDGSCITTVDTRKRAAISITETMEGRRLRRIEFERAYIEINRLPGAKNANQSQAPPREVH